MLKSNPRRLRSFAKKRFLHFPMCLSLSLNCASSDTVVQASKDPGVLYTPVIDILCVKNKNKSKHNVIIYFKMSTEWQH